MCCGEPWPASLRYSFLLKGKAICSQHNTEKPEGSEHENGVFNSSDIHVANVLHFFCVSSDEFEGILDIHVAYVL